MKFDNLYKLILQQLTAQQKALTDQYTIQRSKDLSFGPIFKQQRTYFDLGKISFDSINVEIPPEINDFLDYIHYGCDNYAQGYAYKLNDPNKRLISIGKLLFKQFNRDKKSCKSSQVKEISNIEYKKLKKLFDQRLDGNIKKEINCSICITHNPYDIAGMSTNRRHWTSCMNLDNGAFKTTPLKQVKYGGMVAYLIESSDRNIENPLARVAIKRLVAPNGGFVFVSENKVYGKENFAKAALFNQRVIVELRYSNQLTKNNSGFFVRKDDDSYSDSQLNTYIDYDKINLDELSPYEIDQLSDKSDLPKQFIQKNFEKLNHGLLFNNVPYSKQFYFLNKYKDRLKWDEVSKYFYHFDEDQIAAFAKYLDFSKIFNHFDYLPEELVKQRFNILNLTEIVKRSCYDENNIVLKLIKEKHAQNKVDWNDVSIHFKNNLSPLCMSLFRDYIDLNKYFQKLSPYEFEHTDLSQEDWDYIALNNGQMNISTIQYFSEHFKVKLLKQNKNIDPQYKKDIDEMIKKGIKFYEI